MKHLQETQILRVHSKVDLSYLVKVNEVIHIMYFVAQCEKWNVIFMKLYTLMKNTLKAVSWTKSLNIACKQLYVRKVSLFLQSKSCQEGSFCKGFTNKGCLAPVWQGCMFEVSGYSVVGPSRISTYSW